MKLVVGLGNPGPKYARTRHNAGFMALDRMTALVGARFDEELCSALVARGGLMGEDVLLAKPQTYMNLSGQAVARIARKFACAPSDITVLHDDIDIELGKVKEKTGGGAGGHNGVASVAEVLGTPDFRRIRIGVGRPPAGVDAAEYVLSPFHREEAPLIEASLEEACRRALNVN